MRSYVFLLLVAVVCVEAVPVMDPYAVDMKIREQCLDEVERQVIKKALVTQHFPYDDIKKDIIACTYRKQYNHIKDVLSKFYKESDLKILDNCKSEVGKSHGDGDLDTLVCVMTHLKAIEVATQQPETLR